MRGGLGTLKAPTFCLYRRTWEPSRCRGHLSSRYPQITDNHRLGRTLQALGRRAALDRHRPTNTRQDSTRVPEGRMAAAVIDFYDRHPINERQVLAAVGRRR